MKPNLTTSTWSDWPGRIFYCPVLPSTNTLLMEELRSGSEKFKNYDVVWTGYQNAGRGRRGKKWVAPNPEQGRVLTFSVLVSFPSGEGHPHLPQLAQVAQVAAWTWATWFREMGISATLKWPNDILFEGKKLAGFLSETLVAEGKAYLVLGMGINLMFTPDFLEFLEAETGRRIVSVACLMKNRENTEAEKSLGVDFLDPKSVLNGFLKKFHPLLELWKIEGFSPFVESWKSISDLIGQKVILTDGMGGERHEVWVEDIAKDGRLIVKDQGQRKTINFGEINY